MGPRVSDLSGSSLFDLTMEKVGHLLVGPKRPVSFSVLHLLERLREASIEGSTLGWRVPVVVVAVGKGLRSENDLASFCFGFDQVAITQAHLDAKTDGNGHLPLALYLYDCAHGAQFPEVGNPDFLKRSIAAHSGAVKEAVCAPHG
jgi:hypothetical protein